MPSKGKKSGALQLKADWEVEESEVSSSSRQPAMQPLSGEKH